MTRREPWQRVPVAPAASAIGGGASPYKLGRAFEVAVRGQLQRREWFVMRAYASKGKIDLLAVGKDRPTLFLQLKRRGQISSQEWCEVFDIATRYGGWPVLCMRLGPRTTGYFRLNQRREFRSRMKDMTQFDPADCSEIAQPPTLPLAV